MSAKSAIKTVVPETPDDQSRGEAQLFKWVAILTGSKNALKGVGFFLGGLLLTTIGFNAAVGAMAAGLFTAFLLTLLLRFTGWATDLFAWLPGAYPAFRIGAFDMLLLYVLVMAMGAWWIWRWRSMRWVLSATLLLLLGSWGLRAKENVERSTFTV
jgi:hypothetical protein